MPINRKDYPPDWETIALLVKMRAGWQCVNCGKQCWKPGDQVGDLYRLNRSEWAKKLLTVAHLNHIPSDCRPENLRAWCAPCHLAYDARQMAAKRLLKRERLGQLTLDLGDCSAFAAAVQGGS